MEIYNVSNPISNHYVNLIKANKKTIDDIKDETIKKEVADILGISLEKITLEEAIEKKIAELSLTCGKVICAGTDVELTNGVKHYSFTSNDQNNIKNLFDIAISTRVDGIPYHADNEECELYPYMDIIGLYVAEQKFILYHNTYFNMLKAMVKAMTVVEDVEGVAYGTELSEEYMEKMNAILAQSEELFTKTMQAYEITVEA